jgi:hypothetical protein
MDDVIKLAAIISEEWQRRFQHVRNNKQQLMAREGLLDARREFVFHVGGVAPLE